MGDAGVSAFTSLSDRAAAPPPDPQRERYLFFPEVTSTVFSPVHLADDLTFVFRTLVADRLVAWYPSPRRPVEIALPEETWPMLVASNPGVAVIEPVDEALLIRRARATEPGRDPLACVLLPSAPCFEIIVSLGTRRHLGFPHEKAESAMRELWATAVSASESSP